MLAPALLLGKSVTPISRLLGQGYGGTWSGEIALRLAPGILSTFIAQVQQSVILVAGTNGKTTTSLMIRTIVTESGCPPDQLVHNASGANLLNGLTGAFLQQTPWNGTPTYRQAILEVDENTLPQVIEQLPVGSQPRVIVVLLNLFRDQLDRYGEVDTIARKWKKAVSRLPSDSVVIANADDPSVVAVAQAAGGKTVYFGIEKPALFQAEAQHTADATYCPSCGQKLAFTGIYFAHLGHWHCPSCHLSRPKPTVIHAESPLPGLYNEYNTLAAVAVAQQIRIPRPVVAQALKQVHPAFGRQEELMVEGKTVKLFLAKNPAGFDASLRTVLEAKPSVLLLVLNDHIPDGRDVSWIWDTDLEQLSSGIQVITSGDRAYDMAIRMKYAQPIQHRYPVCAVPDLPQAIAQAVALVSTGETVPVLATYSAMLAVRQSILGRKIL